MSEFLFILAVRLSRQARCASLHFSLWMRFFILWIASFNIVVESFWAMFFIIGLLLQFPGVFFECLSVLFRALTSDFFLYL